MDEDYYRGVAAELQGKLRRLSTFVAHASSIGAYHEEILKSVIAPLVPLRFSLRTGFCYDKEHGASRQADIILVDENDPGAYFFREGDFAVVHPHAVVAVVQVKARLRKDDFAEAMAVLASFGTMTAEWLPTFVFAFEAPPLTERRMHTWYRSLALPDELSSYPLAVLALNRGMARLRAVPGGFGHALTQESRSSGPIAQRLSVFLETLRMAMMRHGGGVSDPMEYTMTDELLDTSQTLVVGRGIVEAAA